RRWLVLSHRQSGFGNDGGFVRFHRWQCVGFGTTDAVKKTQGCRSDDQAAATGADERERHAFGRNGYGGDGDVDQRLETDHGGDAESEELGEGAFELGSAVVDLSANGLPGDVEDSQ